MGGLLFHSDFVGRSVGETDPGRRRRRVCEANKQIKVLALHWQQIIITNSPTGGALFEYQSGDPRRTGRGYDTPPGQLVVRSAVVVVTTDVRL